MSITPESTASTSTGEHPVYVPQQQAQTYQTPPASEDSHREPPAIHGDVVNVTTPPPSGYVVTRVDVTAAALRQAITALNEEIRKRA